MDVIHGVGTGTAAAWVAGVRVHPITASMSKSAKAPTINPVLTVGFMIESPAH
jgi:hypothetical protein